MAELGDTSLTAEERWLLEGFVALLEARLRDDLHGVWLFGSRARGDQPAESSDVDLLVLAADDSWDGKLRVHAALDDAARQTGLEDAAWSFSVHVNSPAWLEQRRAVRSFFIREVDRDKVVLAGQG